MTEEQEFVRDFKALLEKYQFTVEINTGSYGDDKALDLCIGEKRIAHLDAWISSEDQPSNWTFDV